MKPIIMNFKKLIILPLVILALMVSCQTEETEIINPPEEEVIVANSSTANLMSRTTLNDGSTDNIVDYANCLEVVLPVTVTANGVTIIIESYTDYDALEALLDAYTNDNDNVVITFPITVILNDYTEIVINNQAELDVQIALCNGENEDDDDIECIDFQYPISISIYDSNFQVTDTVTIENDEALYNFIDDLEGGVLASLNFPVTMILSDGNTVVVSSNEELEAAIIAAQDTCDEDDDYDWNDDDINDCNADSIELALKDCAWNIPTYNQSDVFTNYYIDFEPDYNFVVFIGDDLEYAGTWAVSENASNNAYEITLTTNWGDLNGTWEVVNCENGEFELLQGNTNMVIAQDCDTVLDNPFLCTISPELVSCDYDGDGFALYNIYEAIGACSSTVPRSTFFYLSLAGAETETDFLSGGTAYTSTSNPQTVYIRVSINNSQDVYRIYPVELIAEDCTTPCSEQNVNDYLVDCKWNIVSVDGNGTNLIIYDFDFNVDGTLVITNTSNNTSEPANWLVFLDPTTGRIILGFTNINDNGLSDIFGNSGLVACDVDRLEFEKNGSGLTYVMEKDCN